MNVLSNQGEQLLIEREGIKLKAYKDSVGIWTIGIGDTDLDNDGVKDVKPEMIITKEQAISNFKFDVQLSVDTINSVVKTLLMQNQFDALVSFIYNIGISAFKKSTMLKYLNMRTFSLAANEFDKWHIPQSIITRRNGERNQFLGVSYNATSER